MKFEPIHEVFARHGNQNAPVVRCPHYWECGDYATRARPVSKPGKVEVACAYHAQKIEGREEAADVAQGQNACEPKN